MSDITNNFDKDMEELLSTGKGPFTYRVHRMFIQPEMPRAICYRALALALVELEGLNESLTQQLVEAKASG